MRPIKKATLLQMAFAPLFHAAKKLPKKTAPEISSGSIRGYFTHRTAETIGAAAERDGSNGCLQSNGGEWASLPRCVNSWQLSTPAGLRHPKKRKGLRWLNRPPCSFPALRESL
jgi:hypothetical protein